MNIPNFHDGHFDGQQIGPSKLVNIFPRTQDGKIVHLDSAGSECADAFRIKQGNIIFDLVFRGTSELTRSDMAELYSVDVDAPQATNLLMAKREQGYQLFEINASYGAQGLVLFQTFEMRQSTPDLNAMHQFALKYRSGEEIKKRDRVLFHGNLAEVPLVSCDPNDPDPEVVWHIKEYGGGELISDPIVSSRTFIPKDQLDEYEDLEFVSREQGN